MCLKFGKISSEKRHFLDTIFKLVLGSLSFMFSFIIVPTFGTKVTEYLCSG